MGSSPTFGYSYIKAYQSSCSFCVFLLADLDGLPDCLVVLGLVVELFGCCSGIARDDNLSQLVVAAFIGVGQ